MRMTLTLDNDAFVIANAYARARSLDLGQAVSALIRRSGSAKLPMKQVAGAWIVDLPPDAAPLTVRHVQRLVGGSA